MPDEPTPRAYLELDQQRFDGDSRDEADVMRAVILERIARGQALSGWSRQAGFRYVLRERRATGLIRARTLVQPCQEPRGLIVLNRLFCPKPSLVFQ